MPKVPRVSKFLRKCCRSALDLVAQLRILLVSGVEAVGSSRGTVSHGVRSANARNGRLQPLTFLLYTAYSS